MQLVEVSGHPDFNGKYHVMTDEGYLLGYYDAKEQLEFQRKLQRMINREWPALMLKATQSHRKRFDPYENWWKHLGL